MSLCLVSSVLRHVPPEVPSSYLTLVDLETARVLGRALLPEAEFRADDPNPRGGLRGARGLSAGGGYMAAAVGDRVFIMYPDWTLARIISHPWMGSVHGLLADDAGVWVTSTQADLLLRFDWQGSLLTHWHWSACPRLASQLGLVGRAIFDPAVDYRRPAAGTGIYDNVHLNEVVSDGDGLLLSFGQIQPASTARQRRIRATASRAGSRVPVVRSLLARRRAAKEARAARGHLPAPASRGSSFAIVRLPLAGHAQPATCGRVLWASSGADTPKHDPARLGNYLLYNDSASGRLVAVSPGDRPSNYTVDIPGDPPFARGLASLPDGTLLVGSQRPAAVYRVALMERRILSRVELCGEPWETVFSVSPLPAYVTADWAGLATWTSVLADRPRNLQRP